MSTNAQNAYLEGRVLAADPLELVRILYEQALDSVTAARSQLRAGNIAARSQAITRAQLMLIELETALDYERGGDLSVNLGKLYLYMRDRLTTAHVEQNDAPLAEVEHLLTTVLEGWRNCRPESDPATLRPPVANTPAPHAYAGMLESEPELAAHSWTY